MPYSRLGERQSSRLEAATDPVAVLEADAATDSAARPEPNEASQRQDDITQELTEAAGDEERGRSFARWIRRRAVWLPLACVAAVLVGFGCMTALLRVGDRLAQPATKPVPTTAAPVAPAPPDAVTAPPAATTNPPAVEDQPPPPAQESAPPAPAPSETTTPLVLNPAGHAPPGLNK